MQIMKGYHCSSDSVNLRVLHNVCVCVCVSIWLCVCSVQHMYCIYCKSVGVGRGTVPLTLTPLGRPSGPPDSTLYPSMLTVAASYSFLKTTLKLHSLLLILTEALGSPLSTRTCLLSSEEDEKRKAEKGGRAVQLSLCLASSFLFSYSHLKL